MKKRLYQALSALGVLLFLASFYVPVKGEPLMVLGSDTTPPSIYGHIREYSIKIAEFGTSSSFTYPDGKTIQVCFYITERESNVTKIDLNFNGSHTYFYPNKPVDGYGVTTGEFTVKAGVTYNISCTAYSGGGSRTLSCTITGAVKSYTLTISCSPSNGGTTSPAPGTHTYTAGTEVTVTAFPNSGYTFNGWTGSVQSSNSTITVKMDSDKSLTANFKSPPSYYTLTVSVNPSGAGSVTKEPNQSSYQSGTQVKLTATPSSAVYYFTGWSGDASGTSNPLTVTMDRNRNITANFARKDDPAGNFYINNLLCTPESILYASTRTFSFKFVPTKSAGEISRVWVEIKGPETLNIDLTKQSDGSWTGQYTFGKDGTYTLNCKLSWAGGTVTIVSTTFGGQEEVPPGYVKIEYICSPRIGGALVGAVSPVPLGTHVEVEAFPNQGWRFVGWKGDVPPDYTHQKLGFIADKENMVIIAEFKSIEPMISTPTAMRIFGAILILSGAIGWLVERRKYAW